jgi:hypothetical protein
MPDQKTFAPLSGGCACGHVRYRMESPPIIVHGCHCRFCQRVSGSAFAVNAMIEADRVASTGDGAPEPVHTPSALPAGQKIHRCPRCFVPLWSNHSLLGEAIVFVYVGTLDEAGRLAPDVHCFTATKHPWVDLPDGVPAFEDNYDSAMVWSADATRRVEAAMRGAPPGDGPEALPG